MFHIWWWWYGRGLSGHWLSAMSDAIGCANGSVLAAAEGHVIRLKAPEQLPNAPYSVVSKVKVALESTLTKMALEVRQQWFLNDPTALPAHCESSRPHNNLTTGFKGLYRLHLSNFHLFASRCSCELSGVSVNCWPTQKRTKFWAAQAERGLHLCQHSGIYRDALRSAGARPGLMRSENTHTHTYTGKKASKKPPKSHM